MQSQNLNIANVNNKYKVSIIVPCYNVLPWVDQCLESLINQTLESIEIIAINDGSTDGTGDKLDQWQNKYPDKIKVIHKTNGGPSARNLGMKIAQGAYIGFVDSDDFVDTTMFAKLYEAIVSDNTYICYCNLQHFYDDNKEIKKATSLNLPKKILLTNKANIEQYLTKVAMTFSFCCALFKTSFIKTKNVFYDTSLRLGEELCFHFQLLFQHPSITIVDEVLYYYRQNRSGQLTKTDDTKLLTAPIIFNFLLKNMPVNFRKDFKSTILYKQLTLHATLCGKIKKQLLFNYLRHCSYNVFSNHKFIDIYKMSLLLTVKRNYRYLPFVLLLNILFIFKQPSMPQHAWITNLFNK